MKKLIGILCIASVFLSCNDSDELENGIENGQLPNNFVVDGTITSAAGKVAYVETASQNGMIEVANATIDANGKFKIEGNIPGMGIYQLRIGDGQEAAIPLTMAPKDKIHVAADFNSFSSDAKITGVDWGSNYSSYMKLFNEFGVAQQELSKLQNQVAQEELEKRYFELRKPLDDFALKAIQKNPGSTFNLVLSNSLMPAQGFKDYPEENIIALRKMSKAFSEKYENSPITEKLAEQVTQIEYGYSEYQLVKSGKKQAPEIALKSPEGNEIKLSSLRGKVVLIDFWASWCGPCRKENPNVIRLYNKYKNKGFTIYSVSLDDKLENWKQAIEADGLVWPNHVSDLTGWQTPLTQVYGFNSIPHTVLIDKNGNIIEIGLRGAELERKLEEVLSK